MPWVDSDTHGWVLHPKNDKDWDGLLTEYGGAYPKPLTQLLATVRAAKARTVVVENRYVDLDYRSEYSAYWSGRFEAPPAFARRLHFFTTVLNDSQLHNIPAHPGYLGYSVLRPLAQGRVGRTVIAPPPSLENATLALIEDDVSLFGNALTVRGVPFCQQDGEFLRCAQAAAWMCHYSAHRRGLVGRETTAAIVDKAPALLSVERALPSKGMNLNQLQAVFGELGQPALFYGLSNMPKVRGVTNPKPKLNKRGDPRAPGFWDRRILSVVCRYLNSGFPVLIGSEDHAFVLVGWFRDGKEVRLVATDDQVGPYEVIDSPFTHYKAPWRSIMTPLPPKAFLTGESAESQAYRDILALSSAIDPLKPVADGLRKGRIKLRCSLKRGRDLKRDIAGQTSSEEALRLLRLARLPHWVWIVEAHFIAACQTSDPCVIAAAVYDSTSFDLSPRRDALTLPGALAVYPPDGGQSKVVSGGTKPWHSMLAAH